MQPVHKTLLEVNEEFLVSETPTNPFIKALLDKHVLTDLDLQQLRSLEPQGPRAVKRFVLYVLPQRGPLAYPALLESLQEARAQHLVDLLLEGEAVLSTAVKPIELPEPAEPSKPLQDPNEYARKLRANADLIEDAVDPVHMIPALLRNGVLSPLEQSLLEEVRGQHALTWSVLWGVLMQRGIKAYHAFMGALLQNGYSALFHTIEETKVTGTEALKSAFNRKIATTTTRTTTTDPEHKHHAKDDSKSIPSLTPRDSTGPITPPLRTSSQHSVLRAIKTSDSISNKVPRSDTDSLKPSYSLGELDFHYTPRSEKHVNDSRDQEGNHVHVPRPVDLLYSPTWADPYNHLRSAGGESPSLVYKSFTAGVLDSWSVRPSRDPGFPSAHASVDLPDTNRDETPVPETEEPAFRGQFEEEREMPVLGRLEAISERDADSDTNSHVNDDPLARLSTGRTDDHVVETPKEKQESENTPAPLQDEQDKSRSSPSYEDTKGRPSSSDRQSAHNPSNTDPNSGENQDRNRETVHPETKPVTEQDSSAEKSNSAFKATSKRDDTSETSGNPADHDTNTTPVSDKDTDSGERKNKDERG